MAEAKQQMSTYKGWLYKWTNYLKGYQKRWFVLQNGLLSYYRYAPAQNYEWVGIYSHIYIVLDECHPQLILFSGL